ncbi:MAG: hypothetical protein LC101_07545 [Flavobacteriales bacterium]|nr:hypothetical protein [Flavobacteriales bacterium]
MTTITWDEKGQRYFEAGVDRGVLYIGPDRVGIPWNGLISVEEVIEEEETVVTLDGVQQSVSSMSPNFKAVITAFTYLDELPVDSDAALFGISYRTFVGNDILGIDYGYQIHLLYNLIARTKEIAYETYSTSPTVINFGWDVSGTADDITGFKPTAHVIIDSRFIDADLLEYIEDVLYRGDLGSSSISAAEITEYLESNLETTPAEVREYLTPPPENIEVARIFPYDVDAVGPRLPYLPKLLSVVQVFKAVKIIPNVNTGVSTFELGYGDLTPTTADGLYARLPVTRLIQSDTDGCYLLITE